MLFNAARFKARFGVNGELMGLVEQDRALWNKELIQLAFVNLELSPEGDISVYQYEAFIARIHCKAESFAATDRNTITLIYDRLLKINSNPFVELNSAIAFYYAGKKSAALEILHKLESMPFFNQYYLIHAALGRIYFAESKYVLAKKYITETIRLTSSPAKKNFIQRLMDKIKNA
jgi:predicted RNA polymerase sigma factor